MQPDKKANQTLKLLFAVGAVLIPLVVPSGSHAADAASGSVAEPAFDPARFEPSSADGAVWSLIVGAGALYAPEYEGSRGFKVSPLPAVIFTYGDWLTLDPRGISVTAFTHQGFSLAGKVGYEMGRDEDDGDRLKGLGDIDFAATIGARATYRWEALELYAEVDQTVGGSESLIGKFGAEYTAPVTDRFFVSAGISATVANEEHMQSYFGVTAAQSAASGLRAFKPQASLKRVDFSVSATYMATENWLMRGEVGMGALLGDAADSPIVERELQPSFMAIVGYKF
ncbi:MULTISPECIES: MipA/OmpV family protein [unclassified Shinella]|jgi:outer membrane scaffolding protein for murein synthesis (MipA/OmpV family)|uniref:MipA/OmpV family protein n=1 Tax=unclassified Shinella TaxID=2643062 RepID=UPI0006809571|nr:MULTISPECIES: MipA/OmpV family protein [unclassified Shinella]